MTLHKTWFRLLLGGICGIVILAGCAPQTKNRLLNIFFDGVPGSPGETAARSARPQKVERVNLPPIWADPPRMDMAAGERPISIHKPYEERRCIECHASNFSQRLKGDVSAICTACHKGFQVKAKYSHAPVVEGQCTLCHEPHQAREKFLLVRNIRDLCFDCHDPAFVFLNKGCEAPTSRACTECHDPHLEDRRFRLYPPGKTSPVYKMTPEK